MEIKENKMGVMPIRKLLYSMSWPAILSMTINALYNIVDSMFVAQLGEDALSAVSLVGPFQFLIVAVGVGSGVGANSLISRKLGEKDQKAADQAASTTVFIGLINYVLFVILGTMFPKLFLGAFISEGSYIYEAGYAYLAIICFGSLFFQTEMQIVKILQATGNMIAPMKCSITGVVVNLILDPLLIFGIGIFPKMGVAGAALATIIAQFCAMSVGVYMLLKGDHLVEIKIKGFRVNWKIVKEIYKVGMPSIVMQSIFSVMILFYNMILVEYSTVAVAVLGVYIKIQSFVFMPVFGLNQGAMPIIGYNFGAGNKERLVEVYKEALKVALGVMVVGFIIFQTIPETLLGMFNASDKMIEIGVPALRLISISFVPAAVGIINSTVFQATGYGIHSMMVAILRQLVGILPMAYFLTKIGGVQLSWLSFPLADILALGYSIFMLNRIYKKRISNF